jgi:hypothetical protein
MPPSTGEFHRAVRLAGTVVVPALFALSSAHGQGSPDSRRPVSLVVVITVDQMRGDYIARGGCRWTVLRTRWQP